MMAIDEAVLIEPQRLVWPGSWAGHIPFASWLVAVLRPDVLVELGTHTGNSYGAFCQAITENKLATRAYAVDTWRGDEHAGTYDESVFLDLKKYHDPLYGAFSTLLRMTFDEAAERFPDGSVDLLHIDGLHTYEAVKHDFKNWLPKVSARGVVLFHDTNVYEATFGVHRLWAEVSQQYPGFNFEHSHGLGVLLVGEQRRPELLEMAESAQPNEKWLSGSRLFRGLGASIERRAQIVDMGKDLSERDARIADLNQAVSDRDAHIGNLTQAVGQRDAQLVAHRNTISWRITKPLRLFGR